MISHAVRPLLFDAEIQTFDASIALDRLSIEFRKRNEQESQAVDFVELADNSKWYVEKRAPDVAIVYEEDVGFSLNATTFTQEASRHGLSMPAGEVLVPNSAGNTSSSYYDAANAKGLGAIWRRQGAPPNMYELPAAPSLYTKSEKRTKQRNGRSCASLRMTHAGVIQKDAPSTPIGYRCFMAPTEDAELRSLLTDLQAIPFDREEKTSELEILIDFLEIVAVAAGEKPAHLQGQGMRSRSFIRALDHVAAAHGLLVMRTPPVPTFYHRAPDYDPRFFEWERERDRESCAREGQVLWIYRDRDLEPAIRAAVEGATDVSEVLGYPACCVRENSELGIRLSEARVRGYQAQYGARDTEDLIRLATQDARVDIPRADLPRFLHVFPYVQFSPCRACGESPSSPAAEINWAMKRLATRISPAFQRAIDKAAKTREARAARRASR